MAAKRLFLHLFILVCTVSLVTLFASSATAQAPLVVGDEHPVRIESDGISDVETTPTPRGLRFRLRHKDATYIALHFAEFELGEDEVLRISDAEGGQSYELIGRGKMGAGTFWSQHVKGDTVVLELDRSGPGSDRGFRVDRYAAGFIEIQSNPVTEAICSLDDKENAVCYQTSHPTEYNRARAIARLLIQGTSLCTGWLASANNHLITNEHCISTAAAALNTDYEFAAEAPTCGSTNCQLCYAGNIYSGATFIQDNASLDYALLQIDNGDPAATYGYLEIDDRVAQVGEQIYIPQHPGGRAKELGIESTDDNGGVCHVNTFSSSCTGGGYQDVGYQCDTEGGSSGSPVLASSSHKVIALHHCANCPNRGVPIDLICDEVCHLFGPECVVDGDCDDGNACTADSCDAGACSSTPIADCCGNDVCESGEDCNFCPQDCIGGEQGGFCGDGVCDPQVGEDCVSCPGDCNGRQTGRPSNRFCCGDGDGVNPVGCEDSRCMAPGFSCGPVQSGAYCCGDGFCTNPENSMSCLLDCGPAPFCGDNSCDIDENSCSCSTDCGIPPASEIGMCNDGVDNDCDGTVDCSDDDCSSDQVCMADCGSIGDKRSCNAEPQCRWNNRTKVCIDN